MTVSPFFMPRAVGGQAHGQHLVLRRRRQSGEIRLPRGQRRSWEPTCFSCPPAVIHAGKRIAKGGAPAILPCSEPGVIRDGDAIAAIVPGPFPWPDSEVRAGTDRRRPTGRMKGQPLKQVLTGPLDTAGARPADQM